MPCSRTYISCTSSWRPESGETGEEGGEAEEVAEVLEEEELLSSRRRSSWRGVASTSSSPPTSGSTSSDSGLLVKGVDSVVMSIPLSTCSGEWLEQEEACSS